MGDVFTPLAWAKYAAQRYGVLAQWLAGKSVFDPTMGQGALLAALIELGLEAGYTLAELPVHNLYGNERDVVHFQAAIAYFQTQYGLSLGNNLSNDDILEKSPQKFDVLFGNPPWINFSDLPNDYKEFSKRHFSESPLVDKRSTLLLGNSRIDVSALIVQRSIDKFLNKNGEAIFFLPLSLFLNEGAHTRFRQYALSEHETYALLALEDFDQKPVFAAVSTRYGLAHFKRNAVSNYPISYWIHTKSDAPYLQQAAPLLKSDAPLSVSEDVQVLQKALPRLCVNSSSLPRQGINTSGANALFFFEHCEEQIDGICLLSNAQQKNIKLPTRYIYPLISAANFKQNPPVPERWVFLPYTKDGRPLSNAEKEADPLLKAYLDQHEAQLRARKGVLIQSAIQKGAWWALLGVGAYNFAACKVVWEAYGKSTFRPQVFEGRWQANQSLQAYMPFSEGAEAARVQALLAEGSVEAYLRSLRMAGAMNWAQPGKIRALLTLTE